LTTGRNDEFGGTGDISIVGLNSGGIATGFANDKGIEGGVAGIRAQRDDARSQQEKKVLQIQGH
jgi:hypothetical protein